MHVTFELIRYAGKEVDPVPNNPESVCIFTTANRVRQEVTNHVLDAEIVKTMSPGQSIEIANCHIRATPVEAQWLLDGMLSQWISWAIRKS